MKSCLGILMLLGIVLGGSQLKAQEPAGQRCVPAKLEDLQAAIKARPAKEIVFFASWCGSCKKHLTEAGEDELFVASFDEQDRVEAVLKQLRGERPLRCYWDQNNSIAKYYKVRGLPARRPIQP